MAQNSTDKHAPIADKKHWYTKKDVWYVQIAAHLSVDNNPQKEMLQGLK